MSISFFLRKRDANSKEGRLYAKITWGGKSVRHSFDVKLSTDYFANGKFKRNALSKYSRLRKRMEDFREEVEQIHWDLLDNDEVVTPDRILHEYKKGKEVKYIVSDGFKMYSALDISNTTRAQYKSTLATFQKWLKDTKGVDDITINELTQSLLNDIEIYARKTKGGTRVHYVLSRIVSIYNYYAEQGYAAMTKFKVNSKAKSPRRVVLSMEEVDILLNKSIEGFENDNKDRLQVSLDLFLFMTFTGLSYVDVMALKYDDIAEYEDQKIIDMSRLKTNNPFVVPLLPESVSIIERYQDYKLKEREKVFPWMRNQVINYHIKKIAKELKIEKNIHAHIARHTFATTICLNNNVDIESVSGMLGHKSIKTTQIYAKINKERILNSTKDLHKKLRETT